MYVTPSPWLQDDRTIQSLTLGCIASFYYLHHTTVRLFREKLYAHSTFQDLLQLLCVSQCTVPVCCSCSDLVMCCIAGTFWGINSCTEALPQTLFICLVSLTLHIPRMPRSIMSCQWDIMRMWWIPRWPKSCPYQSHPLTATIVHTLRLISYCKLTSVTATCQ